MEYRIGAGAWTACDWTPFTILASTKSVEVWFRGTDAVGNVGAEEVRGFFVDDAAPDVEIVTPRAGSMTARDAYFETDSDSDGFPDAVELAWGSDPEDDTR